MPLPTRAPRRLGAPLLAGALAVLVAMTGAAPALAVPTPSAPVADVAEVPAAPEGLATAPEDGAPAVDPGTDAGTALPDPETTDPDASDPETTDPEATDPGTEEPTAGVLAAPRSVGVLATPLLVAPLRAGTYRMTSPQGPRCAPTINASLAHMGQDLAAPLGTPIYAIADGVVRYARPEASAGQWIVLEHVIAGKVVSSSYSHSRNATEFVRAGDRVTAGQRIATVASTGVSTGPHLHLEIWEGRYGAAAGGKVVNPDTWLAARGVSLRAGATSVLEVRPPTSCTYWAKGRTALYASASSSAAVVTSVPAGTVITTPGAGQKVSGYIHVTAPTGLAGWAPASQVSPQRVAAGPSEVLDHDFTGDANPDVLAIDARGRLLLYPGNGQGGWLGSRQVGAGWSAFRLVPADDWNGDGRADVFGIDAGGKLWLYPGNGAGGFRARVAAGHGWSAMRHVFSPGDFDGDRRADLVAVDRSGKMWLYPGNGRGGFAARTQIGHGWQGFARVTAGADLTGDGAADVVAVSAAGQMWVYPGNGRGRFMARVGAGGGWPTGAVVAVGPFDGDARDDLLVVGSGGALTLHPGRSGGVPTAAGRQVGRGWSGFAQVV